MQLAEPIGIEADSGISDGNQFGRSCTDALIASARDVGAGGNEDFERQARLPLLKSRQCSIRGAAVDDHDFVGCSMLLGNRRQERVERGGLVEHRQDERDALSGVTANHGKRPASLARSPPLATLTLPAAAQGTATFQNCSVARCARTMTLSGHSWVATGRP